jgi:two-component system NarL family sensor kinase
VWNFIKIINHTTNTKYRFEISLWLPGLLMYMHISLKEVNSFIAPATAALLMTTAFFLFWINWYNRRKKSHQTQQGLLSLTFETELAKSRLEIMEHSLQTVGAVLHDDIGQLLSLTSLTLNSIALNDISKLKHKIEDAIEFTRRSIKEMRLLGKLFQDKPLMKPGLNEAIQYQVSWLKKAGQPEITYTFDGQPPATPNQEKDSIICSIIQEILDNSIKRAYANHISIHLHYKPAQLRLLIVCNGIGFNAHNMQAPCSGTGLNLIYKRSSVIGGVIDIKSETGKGTTIEITIPYT